VALLGTELNEAIIASGGLAIGVEMKGRLCGDDLGLIGGAPKGKSTSTPSWSTQLSTTITIPPCWRKCDYRNAQMKSAKIPPILYETAFCD
jgi:hypothetical protein